MSKREFDLEQRTSDFGKLVIDLCKTANRTTITRPIISQLTRSATSVGANYMEANAASSRKDFRNKIFICRKEAQETKHWINMLMHATELDSQLVKKSQDETRELVLIFSKITRSLDENV